MGTKFLGFRRNMNPEVVVVESDPNRSKLELLDAALEKTRFNDVLETAWNKSRKH